LTWTCDTLVEGHLDAVHAYARVKLSQEDLAKGIVQRTFLKTFEKLGQLRDVLAARACLLPIFRNDIAMEFRSSARLEGWSLRLNRYQCRSADHEFRMIVTMIDRGPIPLTPPCK